MVQLEAYMGSSSLKAGECFNSYMVQLEVVKCTCYFADVQRDWR